MKNELHFYRGPDGSITCPEETIERTRVSKTSDGYLLVHIECDNGLQHDFRVTPEGAVRLMQDIRRLDVVKPIHKVRRGE